ncbi:unknown [Crocosphaera subtropica ATCC 51142]|uniref:DAGKc domain-containing protein n=1 Tax=Crocosphaera subtropica (strain ATCC 51142 / BH68) TaxID=43989 RepID=B1WZJ6_CROS5|nr:YegS/Rv2252/BmrU family lipid kinase [Crocosphaera subtropica]ACB51148.1 unknown [Crocosphaera subtropica ATCC 51142]
MTRSACLIFNPVAGQGDPEQELTEILSWLTPVIDLDIKKTTQDIGADQLAQQALKQGVKTIIASGGDGTISAVAGVLINTDAYLGIIARGTANAFASALGIPDTIEQQCQTILEGKTKVVDTALCNGKPMIVLAAIGLEANTIREAERDMKDNLGQLAYILSGVQQLQELEKFTVEINNEDKTIRLDAIAVSIANAAPPTSFLAQGSGQTIVDDGLLEITVLTADNAAETVATSYHLLQKALLSDEAEHQDITYWRTQKVKITTIPPQRVAIDGDVVSQTPLTIECKPRSLSIFAPSQQLEKLNNQAVNLLPNSMVDPEQKSTINLLNLRTSVGLWGLIAGLLGFMFLAYFLSVRGF